MYRKSILIIVVTLIYALCVGVFDIFAQDTTPIQGTVIDAETGAPLPGVNVTAGATENSASPIGTSTDMNGEYEIQIPDNVNILVFSLVGYQRLEVEIDGRSEINVELSEDVQLMEDVVVVGYGTQAKEALTGSVGTIQGTEISEQASVSTSAALMGKVPGVQVTQNSGQPGSDQGTIRIRGTGTLGNANALVLIDGVEGNIDDVASSDIENISILKDAASASIYGSRAANGVILITTKRGRAQDFQVSYSGSVGYQSATDLPGFVDAGTFMRLENLGATNLGAEAIWSESFIQEWEGNHPSNEFPNTNWVDAVFTEPALQQRHNIGIAGGSENATYRGSLQYDDQNGEIKNFAFDRYNLRFNSDINATDKVSFIFDVNAVRTDQQEPTGGLELITRQTYRLPAIYLDKFSNGNFAPGFAPRNPVAQINAGGLATTEREIFRGKIGAIFEPVDGLQFNFQYAPNYNSTHNQTMNKQWQSIDPETGEVLVEFPSQNSRSESFYKNWQHNLNFTANFQQDFRDHSYDLLGGWEYISSNSENFGASRDNFPLQDIEVLSAGSAANMQNFGGATEWKLLSFFGRLNYEYRSKYQFSANLRYDGSSRFTESERWGIFPSFSAGWRVGQESFMQSVNFINEFKIRGSWGVLGNQQIGNFPFAASVELGQDYIFGGQTVGGAAQLDLANPNISWEETTTTNIGADLILFNDRISATLDWFNKTTDDILLRLPVPLIVGVNPAFQNAGEVENEGWEIDLGYSETITPDFSFRIGINLSKVNNKVIDLNGAGPFIGGSTITKEGAPINSIYGWVSDGFFQSQAEIDAHADQSGNIAPGDIRYVDLNGDGVINGDDRTIIGDPFPSFNYGFNISANFRNFDLSAFFQGVGSRDVMLQGDVAWSLQNAGNVQPHHVENHWTPDNPNADFPRLTRTTSHNNFRSTDFWMADASYLRLRNLQIGYSIPQSVISGLANDIRVYFLGQNLFTVFDDMPPGVDPNIPNNTPGGFFPVQRVLSAGIDINF